jgi:hypothetical protein
LKIEGRAADDLQHVAGRGLVLERFLQVAGALLQLAEQPRILHRDHRLRGEILQQRDLLLGERPNLPAVDHNVAEHPSVLQQRHQKVGAGASEIDQSEAIGVAALIGLGGNEVGDVNKALTGQDARRPGAGPINAQVAPCVVLNISGRHPVCRGQTEPLAVIGAQLAEGTAAQAQRFRQHRIEHRGEVAGRAVDDLQYLGSRRLLLQGLARLGDQPRVLHRDHRLRREILQ